DSVMRIVADYYDRHGSANEQMRAHYLLGCTYRDLKDVPMELQCFQDATEKADTTQKDCDLYTLYAIYGQMADLYHKQYLLHEELNALEMCEKVAELDHDTISAIHAYELRMRAYILLNETDSVLSISQTSRKRYIEQGEREYAARAIAAAKSCLIDQRRFSEAKEYIDIYEQESGEYISLEKHTTQATLHLYDKGLYYLHENKIDSAQLCFRQLGTEKENEGAYKGLLLVYQQLHQPDSMAKYAILYTQASESGYINKNSQTVEQMTAMYDYNRHKEVAMKNLMEAKSAKEVAFWLALVVAVLWFLAIFVGVIINNRNKEKEREFLLLFKRLSDTKAMVEELEAEKAELEATKTLSSEQAEKLVALQSELQAYKEETRQLVEKVHRTKAPEKPVDFDSWLEEFRRNRTIEELRSFVRTPKPGERLSPELMIKLHRLFNAECPRFARILSSAVYDLNDLEKRVIMLNICDFSTSDIANILGKTPQQISNTHNRIKNKLFPSLTSTHQLKRYLLTMLGDSFSPPPTPPEGESR
ncbi:MAG: hypothetical protein Q4D33_07665, partial [Prevotellaceae bacterium]|nr:hypothetical protein [Prevotellaceae bacterium]